MIATYNFWFGVGGFAAAIGLQIAVDHHGYMSIIHSQWVFISVMVIVFCVVPESPCERAPPSIATMTDLRVLPQQGAAREDQSSTSAYLRRHPGLRRGARIPRVELRAGAPDPTGE